MREAFALQKCSGLRPHELLSGICCSLWLTATDPMTDDKVGEILFLPVLFINCITVVLSDLINTMWSVNRDKKCLTAKNTAFSSRQFCEIYGLLETLFPEIFGLPNDPCSPALKHL